MKKLFVLLFAAAAVTACGDASELASAIEEGADQAKEAAAAGTEAAADAAADATDAAADAAADMDAAPEAE